MPALGFSAISVPRLPASAAGAKPWKSQTEQRVRFFPIDRRRSSSAAFERRAAFSSSVSSLGDFDLYELLGLDSSSDQSQIKSAYRALQKQCHPDVAGPAGHDMAIILNEAYAVLSDPRSRSVYDEERAKKVDFHGFTGRPLYSTWLGPESEERAVFVDEVRCVGCLKCALVARNTFAIETVYGRARVVAQWGDSEGKILDAVNTCPVDCISIVARSDLPALEFLMSKQPRCHVDVTSGAAAGNIFSDVKKFLRRYSEMNGQDSKEDSKESVMQREMRASAVRGIRSISSWWFRRSSSAAGSPGTHRKLVVFAGKRTGSFGNRQRLQEAAAKRLASGTTKRAGRAPPAYHDGDEYWTPVPLSSAPHNSAIVDSIQYSRQAAGQTKPEKKTTSGEEPARRAQSNPAMMIVPEIVAAIAAATVGAEGGGRTSGGLEQHIAGAAAAEIVNSSWLQILLAGITWYIIAAGAVGLIGLLRREED